MKTVFIVVDTGAAIRNVLRTEIFATLRQRSDLRLVVFTPLEDAALEGELAAENVFFERVPRWKPSWPVIALRSLRRDLWASLSALYSYALKRGKRGGQKWREGLLALLTNIFFQGNGQGLMDFLHRWEMRITPLCGQEFFRRYQPELLFFTTLYSAESCIEAAAWKQGIKTVCLIHSWDNPTTKGPFPFMPDRVVVWNEILKEEVVRYHRCPADRVRISGVPQFDLYCDQEAFLSREAFFARHGLDPARKLVTYTTSTTALAPFEPELVERLHHDLLDPAFPGAVQLLVRFHPKDDETLYRHLQGRPHLILARPGVAEGGVADRWNPTREDMYGLAELMAYSDVVINVASTITLDAVMFDRPVINIAFDADRPVAANRSCRVFYDYEHYRRVVQTGGVAIAHSHGELMAQVAQLLADPERHGPGRQRIRQEQAHFLDGRSSWRVAEFILDYLDE